MFETTNAFLSETLRDGEKPLSYLNSGEKILSESHIFLSETKKKLFFVPQCNYLFMDKKISDIKWILKARGELLNLNCKIYNEGEAQICFVI